MPKPYFQNSSKIQEIIMVDHAGEYGAMCIYKGQLNCIKNAIDRKLIMEMLNQELEHLKYFENQIQDGLSSPTVLLPLWKVLGYTLGGISAKMGSKFAMLLTENIEKVIVDHYQKQINYLERVNYTGSLLNTIRRFKQDEADHIHIAIDNNSQRVPVYGVWAVLVQLLCKIAIFMSIKI
jgi:ubiquinone biosynthesis monooxygenase Coq7